MTKKPTNRRAFLKSMTLAPVLVGASWPLLNWAESPSLRAQTINDRITLISGAGGNVVMYRGANGVTLIDSGTREQAPELLSMVGELSDDAPITTLFNTHWHDDHTGGNEVIHAAGADIIAHENTKLWLGAEFEVYWRNSHHAPRPQQALPTSTFYESGRKDLGGEVVEYKYFARAHTDGDICLYFPTSNVLVTGGLMSDGSYPIPDIATGGWLGELIEANAALLNLVNEDTVIIPESGPARTKADLQAQHDMLTYFFNEMKSLMQQGFSGHNMLEEGISSKYDSVWGDPTEFVMETYRGMWSHTYDMGGFI